MIYETERTGDPRCLVEGILQQKRLRKLLRPPAT